MSDNYLQINPNEFAMQVVATSHADTNLSNSALIKKKFDPLFGSLLLDR